MSCIMKASGCTQAQLLRYGGQGVGNSLPAAPAHSGDFKGVNVIHATKVNAFLCDRITHAIDESHIKSVGVVGDQRGVTGIARE